MIQYNKHHGVIVPIVTPFTANGDLDDVAVGRIVSHCATGGVAVFVLGTTGEAASISIQKRAQLVKTAVDAAANRVKVYAGIGDNCPEHSIAAANEYLRLGADAVVAHLPAYYPLKAAEMLAYFELLSSKVSGPLILYNIPQTTHMSLPLDVVEPLSHRPNIVGFKDSENAVGRPEETARRLAGRPDFAIFMGAAVLSAKALKLGFDGLVPSSGNLTPNLWRELYDKARAGSWEAVDALQARLNMIAQTFQRDRSLGESLATLKALMAVRGLCGPTVLPPLRTLDGNAREAIQHSLEAINLS
jgi:4-hydroxy-tetrahydrodipicolinate synthase